MAVQQKDLSAEAYLKEIPDVVAGVHSVHLHFLHALIPLINHVLHASRETLHRCRGPVGSDLLPATGSFAVDAQSRDLAVMAPVGDEI